jgi:hypothetical protein
LFFPAETKAARDCFHCGGSRYVRVKREGKNLHHFHPAGSEQDAERVIDRLAHFESGILGVTASEGP